MADAETVAQDEGGPGEKELNKTPSPKPDQDQQVAPPLVNKGKKRMHIYLKNTFKKDLIHVNDWQML